ncbi:MAG: polyribonucleotide nucleotidyltransferase, partial [Limnochordia bacterium]
SVDNDNPPDLAALVGASMALMISDIPFDGPIGGVRVGRVDGEFIINPTLEQNAQSDMSVTVAGSSDAVIMVEAGANEVPEEDMLEAIMFAHEEIKRLCSVQEKMQTDIGKEKVDVPIYRVDATLEDAVRQRATDRLVKAIKNPDKLEREADIQEVYAQVTEEFSQQMSEEEFAQSKKDILVVLEMIVRDEVRRMISEDGIRPDGRALDEIRPISSAVGILPRAHGSAVFTRGQTQVLNVCTLGVKSDEQRLDDLGDEETKRYIHHYNFPPYSVGEVKPLRGPGRREIGHGALAERALLPVVPDEFEFPYTLRLVSEVLESNGSTSQASVCASTLSLMDAGVPIKRPVAGIAMGLIKHGDEFTILSDIQGMEDFLGDMDFKVAGTEKGVTALQMDIKIRGITKEILRQALKQAHTGRMYIMEKMLQALPTPRTELSSYAPRIITMEIPKEKIRDVIGPGGKNIRKIIDQTETTIDIEDDGKVYIAAVNQAGGEAAKLAIERITADVEVGKIYTGIVKRVVKFGAFVEILPGKEGLVHISHLAPNRVSKVEDVVNEGDSVIVKVIEIDRQGRINLSIKEALPAGDNGKTS